MCIEFTLGENVKYKTLFLPKGKILIQLLHRQPEAIAVLPNRPVLWDGWAKSEEVCKFMEGPWRRAEIFASKFNQCGRWYEVPEGEILRGIAFDTDKQTILKIVTRKAVGLEKEVQERFADTAQRILREQ